MGKRAFLNSAAALLAVGLVAGCTAAATAALPASNPGTRSTATAAKAAPKAAAKTTSKAAPKTTAKAKTAAKAATADTTSTTATTVTEGICTAPAAHKALAAKLSADIENALRGRDGTHAVSVYDRVTGVYCLLNGSEHFASASIVKAIILAALLHWHQETKTPLSDWEQDEATLMITQSDNDAATALWDEVGMDQLQDFLDLAKMNQTQLGQDGYWGLTQVTAHDEMLLLELLTAGNSVLDAYSRSYELGLMSQVISSQRWGVPAGAPAAVTVHVKNGWLDDAEGWHINSIGAFTGNGRNYMIAVLTDNLNPNDDEQYGIDTIQNVAEVVHRDLNDAKLTQASSASSAAARLAAANSDPSPGSPSPWAVVPALPKP